MLELGVAEQRRLMPPDPGTAAPMGQTGTALLLIELLLAGSVLAAGAGGTVLWNAGGGAWTTLAGPPGAPKCVGRATHRSGSTTCTSIFACYAELGRPPRV